MEPTQFERLKQALKQQKDRGAITLEEYLEELDKLQVPQVSLQRQGATGAADSAAAADLLRMRQTPAAVSPSPQLLPSQSSGQERQQQRQSAAKRAKVASLAAMRERVGAEMAEAMDTGVRVNVALAQALGVEVPERLRPEEGTRGSDDETSSGASDESGNESFTV